MKKRASGQPGTANKHTLFQMEHCVRAQWSESDHWRWSSVAAAAAEAVDTQCMNVCIQKCVQDWAERVDGKNALSNKLQ